MSPKALLLLASALFSTAALLQGCGGGGDDTLSTIPVLAGKTAELSTLVAALKAADLVSTLNSTGPFTVFAPTNDAFKALPFKGAELKYLLSNKNKLTEVLEYHVASGDVMSGDLKNAEKIKMLMGGSVTVTIADGTVTINDAKVKTANVKASNGVVHIIDKVLIPANFTAPNIPELATSAKLTLLVQAVTAAKLGAKLSEGPLTVFAPTDDAFKALGDNVLKKLLVPANIKSLQQLLEYHVVSGEVVSSELKNGEQVPTLEGQKVNITIKDSKVQVNKASVKTADVFAINGVVHVIDAVLMPPGFVIPTASAKAAQIVV